MVLKKILLNIGLLFAIITPVSACRVQMQSDKTITQAIESNNRYSLVPNITYLTVNNYDLKLDIYAQSNATTPRPTLIFIHGGGWIGGSKEEAVAELSPYLEMGWNAVNVQYRLADVSLAPAAVEDARCALRWVIRNAKQYNIDTNKIVLAGFSAGGHLALTTGMLPTSAGFDNLCPGNENLKVAAIINIQGITDVSDLLSGTNRRQYAVEWLGNQPQRQEIAQRVSPINYVRSGLPPILTIHGDADTLVPYSHAVRLHKALKKAGVPNQLMTIPGGQHGRQSSENTTKMYGVIREFLAQNNIK